jgi:hypothetical protein
MADPPPAAPVATPTPASLAGRYDGGQMEIAAMLELGADGRFHYALSYGALDEEAQGSWQLDGAQVRLTSDPVTPPRFALVATRPLPTHRLRLSLELPPGMDAQYFDARVRLASGRVIDRQLGEDGLDLPLGPADRVVSVQLQLPVYDFQGDAIPLPGAPGEAVRIRFDPNDLGQVAFTRTPLLIGPEGLVLERYGRTLTFRRSEGE